MSCSFRKAITITNAFLKRLDQSGCKPNKIWVNKGSEFYNRPTKSWLQDHDIEIHSAHTEGKSVATERFIITLINKIFKYMTSTSKNVQVDKLDDIANECKNTYQRTIKMKPVDVK